MEAKEVEHESEVKDADDREDEELLLGVWNGRKLICEVIASQGQRVREG